MKILSMIAASILALTMFAAPGFADKGGEPNSNASENAQGRDNGNGNKGGNGKGKGHGHGPGDENHDGKHGDKWGGGD